MLCCSRYFFVSQSVDLFVCQNILVLTALAHPITTVCLINCLTNLDSLIRKYVWFGKSENQTMTLFFVFPLSQMRESVKKSLYEKQIHKTAKKRPNANRRQSLKNEWVKVEIIPKATGFDVCEWNMLDEHSHFLRKKCSHRSHPFSFWIIVTWWGYPGSLERQGAQRWDSVRCEMGLP